MKMEMSFKQMEPSDAIKEYTRVKSEKLKKYFKGRIHVTWNFSADKNTQSAHCHVLGNHMDYFGQAETEDLHKSIDQVLEKLEKQVRKHKEIVKNHLHKGEPDGAVAAIGELQAGNSEEE